MNGCRLMFLGMLLFLPGMTGCETAPSPGEADAETPGLLDREWRLVALNDEPVEPENEERRPNLTLHSEENRMSGFTGCNRMFGAYELDGERLSFGQIGVTKMACPDTMELERKFLDAVQATGSFYLTGPELELFDAEGRNVARFRAADGA